MASCCHRRPTSGLGPAPPVVSPRLGSPAAHLAVSQARPANDGQQGRRRRCPWWLTVIACLVAFLVAQGNPWNSQSQPASVEQWNETRVVDWLQGLGLSRTQSKEIASQFLEADVDGGELLDIDTIEELEALGISARDTRLSRKWLGDKVCSSRLQSYGLASRNVLTTFGSGERPTPSRGTPSTSGRDSSLAALRRTWSFSSRSSSSNWALAGRRLDLGTVSSVGWPSCSSHTSPFSTMLGASARSTGT